MPIPSKPMCPSTQPGDCHNLDLSDYTFLDFAPQSSIANDFGVLPSDPTFFDATNQQSCGGTLSTIQESEPPLCINPAQLAIPSHCGSYTGSTTVCYDIQSLSEVDRTDTSSVFSGDSFQTTCPPESIPPWSYEHTSAPDRRTYSPPPNYSVKTRPISIPAKRSVGPLKPSKASVQKRSAHPDCKACNRAYKNWNDLQKYGLCQRVATHHGSFDTLGLEQIAEGHYGCISIGTQEFEGLVSGTLDHVSSLPNGASRSQNTDEGSGPDHTIPSLSLADSVSSTFEAPLNSDIDFHFEKSIEEHRKSFKCSIPGCQSEFVYQSDLGRHEKTVHMNQDSDEGYRCASIGCKKADKIWTRLDNFKGHVARRHRDEDVEQLVQKSTRACHGEDARFPLKVTTLDMVSQQRSALGHISTQSQDYRQWQHSSPEASLSKQHTTAIRSGPKPTAVIPHPEQEKYENRAPMTCDSEAISRDFESFVNADK